MAGSKLGCVYINVSNLKASINFYKQLLQLGVETRYEERWAQFKVSEDFRLGLLSPAYDQKWIENGADLGAHYNEAFIRNVPQEIRIGNSVVLNLWTDDLMTEYERVSKIGSGDVSEIMYVNLMMPYHCFMVKDPDGNLIEIADA